MFEILRLDLFPLAANATHECHGFVSVCKRRLLGLVDKRRLVGPTGISSDSFDSSVGRCGPATDDRTAFISSTSAFHDR
jgi:hypothetical protein